MTLSSSPTQYSLPKVLKTALIFLTVVILVLGIFFRFNHLERRIYWLDESFTSLSVSAHSRGDLKKSLITGEEVDLLTIEEFQFPNQKTDYRGTIRGLIEDEPQHTPGYFLTARLWLQTWGNSIATIRLFSALTGILCLPLMYFLCLELYNQPVVATMATIFLAVSPFHVLYAQEARPFSLWTLTTLLSCLALLKAQKSSSLFHWLLYGCSMILSCYAFLFSLLTYFAHSIYILISEKLKINRNTCYFVLSGIIMLAGFSPWILILIQNPPSNYTSFPADSFMAYPKAWIRNLSLIFVDLNIDESSGKIAFLLFLIYVLLILALIAYAFFYSATNGRKKPFFFLASLLIIPSLILLLRDFGKGGQMTLRGNYLIPSLMSIQIMVAYLLSSKLFGNKEKNRSFWFPVTGVILTVAIASCSLMTFSQTWWNKDRENIHHKLAEVVSQAEHPLVISDVLTDDEFIRPLSLSHYSPANTKFIFLFEPQAGEPWQDFTLPENYSDIFLYAPSSALQKHLVNNYGYRLTPIFEQNEIYCDYCPDEIFFRLETDKT